MVLICLIVIAALAVCVMSAWRRAGAAPSPAARPAERRPAEVIEEGFSSESIAYGQSVMDHPMLEREAAKLCEKIKTDLQNGEEKFYEIYGGCTSIYYVQDNIGCSAPLEDRRTVIYYNENAFPSEEQGILKGYDQELGVVWALQHLALAELRRKMPEVVVTNASVESDSRAECNIYAIVRK